MLNDITKFRPTKDIDFMGRAFENDIEECKKIISSIASVECEDGVSFLTENISAEFIKEDADYKGVRIHLPYRMDTINSYLSIDIGFGDKIIQGPCELDFPTLLDSPSPNILVYSYESAVAEKFEAIVKLNFLTSRMKDFFDLVFIAERNSFEKNNLKTALETTFNNRGTNLGERAIIFEDKFKQDQNKQIQWTAFLRRNKLNSENNFAEIVERIKQFIEPVFSQDKAQNWNFEEWKWV